jgi:RNA polymerase sigma factor (sigma-70 family)
MCSLLSSEASVAALVRAAKRGDARAIQLLVLGEGPLRRMVEAIKRKIDPDRLASRWEPMPGRGKPDEAEAAARLAILEALAAFDPDRGVAFTTFAYPYIKGGVLKALYPKVHRASDRQPAPKLVDLELGISQDEIGPTPAFERILLHRDPGYGAEANFERLARQETYAALRRHVEALPSNQRDIVRRIFFGNRSRDDVAAERGTTRQAVSKGLNKALARLRYDLDTAALAA